jgi:hypothetical protein
VDGYRGVGHGRHTRRHLPDQLRRPGQRKRRVEGLMRTFCSSPDQLQDRDRQPVEHDREQHSARKFRQRRLHQHLESGGLTMSRIAILLCAALCLLGAAPASAQWAIFMAGAVVSSPSNPAGAAPSGGFAGQIKPTGPIELNRKSIYAGLVNIYDPGNGLYVDATLQNAPLNSQQSATYSGGAGGVCSLKGAATPYGTAALWPGACVQTQCAGDGCSSGGGLGYVIPNGCIAECSTPASGAAIDQASNLASKGAGAGYSVFVSFIRVAGNISNDWGWYAGKTWISSGEGWAPSEATPCCQWAFVENVNPPDSTNYGVISAAVTTGTGAAPTQSFVGSYATTPGVYYEMNIDCVNTSSGTATCEFMVNGVYQSNLTGVSLPTTNGSELYVEIGANWHDNALTNHTPAAYIFKHSFVPLHLTRQQRQYHWLNPWTEYKPKGSL